ncbi:MAG TPA: acyl carrier protein [Bacteroidales bacterium]|nr:acyl carrier protein [Bacteroidales bacterium]
MPLELTSQLMNIDDFITRIEEEFDDLTPGTLKPESIFREVFEWNSINALILIAMVKTEYDVAINAEDIASSKTVADIYRIIEERVS